METICSILDFGALPNTDTLQTGPIQAAIDHCFALGGGTVVIPAGTFRTGGIRLRSRITLRLLTGAVLLGSRDPADYFGWASDTIEPIPDTDRYEGAWLPRDRRWKDGVYQMPFFRRTGSRWNNALIRAAYAEDVAVIGEAGAVLDGADCYDPLGEEFYRGPHGISMHHCRNIRLSGYTFQNSGNWAHNIAFCETVRCEGLRVLAGHDGIHCSDCRDVHISHSEFYTGDDCVAGFANVNVTVSRCTLNSSCSGLRFGGTHVRVEHCHLFGPGKYLHRGSLTQEEKESSAPTASGGAHHRHNMLSAFTYYADPSLDIREKPGDILLTHCRIENTDRFLHYNFSGNEPWQNHRPLGEIAFRHIRAEGIKLPLNLYGDPAEKVTLTMEDLTLTCCPELSGKALIHAAHFDRILLKELDLTGIRPEALIKRWTGDGNVDFHRVQCTLPEDRWVVEADEPFFTQAI